MDPLHDKYLTGYPSCCAMHARGPDRKTTSAPRMHPHCSSLGFTPVKYFSLRSAGCRANAISVGTPSPHPWRHPIGKLSGNMALPINRPPAHASRQRLNPRVSFAPRVWDMGGTDELLGLPRFDTLGGAGVSKPWRGIPLSCLVRHGFFRYHKSEVTSRTPIGRSALNQRS